MDLVVDGVLYTDVESHRKKIDFEVEDLIYADELEPGMRVILPANERIVLPAGEDEERRDKALVRNRWCKVTNLRPGAGITTFIGVYDDGQKHIRTSLDNSGWVVKKDTMPEREEPGEGTDQESNASIIPTGYIDPAKIGERLRNYRSNAPRITNTSPELRDASNVFHA